MTVQRPIRDQPLEAFRYERKFIVEGTDAHQIRAMIRLHPALFVESYPPRWVNNIYFDTPELENYQDNVNGAVDRRKIRLRWYHGLYAETDCSTLEFKIKRGLVGRKIQYVLGPFHLAEQFGTKALQAYFQNAFLPPNVMLMIRDQEPVLVNRYKRWYFATLDGRFRVTIDAEMAFYHISQHDFAFRYRYTPNRTSIVELKYQHADDIYAGKVAAFFPFSMYKNSKYVMGMESVYW